MASKAWYKPSALPQLIARFDPPPSSSSASAERARKKSIEVWTTTCIVTNFGRPRDDESLQRQQQQQQQHPRCTTLVNPANPNLTGPNSFPYFPRGGPQPASQPSKDAHHIMGYVTQWGGMDVGNGMLFSAEAIDGLVHQLGGLRLRAECSLVSTHEYANAYVNQQSTEPEVAQNYDHDYNTTYKLYKDDMKAKCPVGAAVMTSPGGHELCQHYDDIIHTTPPFYKHPPWMTEGLTQTLGIEKEKVTDLDSWSRELLRSCYRQSFKLAFDKNNLHSTGNSSIVQNAIRSFGFGKRQQQQQALEKRLAVPLLGAGCRDFPKDVALEVAALEGASWLSNSEGNPSEFGDCGDDAVVFGLLEEADAESLAERLEKQMITWYGII